MYRIPTTNTTPIPTTNTTPIQNTNAISTPTTNHTTMTTYNIKIVNKLHDILNILDIHTTRINHINIRNITMPTTNK